MLAVQGNGTGTVEWRAADDPSPSLGEILIEVAAAGLNRADLLQAAGLYPPPPGASDVQGLELSGRVVALGAGVTSWQVGDEVCALVPGGAQAELAAVPAGLAVPVPEGVSLLDAAGLPEAAATAWSNLVDVGQLKAGQWALIHGASGGVGSFAVQLAKALGARVIATAGGPERAAACTQLGADVAIDYRGQDFVDGTMTATKGAGADVILDVVGAAYLEQNLASLATGGRLVVIGTQRGTRGELDLGALMAKRASVAGTTLRARPLSEREAIVAALRERVWPLIGRQIRPVIDDRLPMTEPQRAYDRLASGGVLGKLLLAAPSALVHNVTNKQA